MEKEKYFEDLHKDRKESAKIFEKKSMSGFKRILKDMYADKAHFVFELIQNADDAEASNIRFFLREDQLIFIHNGKINFTISDPEKEREDTENQKLGHINSICSIGNTSKNEQKIGKFGIGFKSIFQYTNSPMIVDDHFSFTIKDLFVPYKSELKFEDRKAGDTLFYIPFDKKDIKDKASIDIINKFNEFPDEVLIFLTNIKTISFNYENKTKKIEKKILKKIKTNGLTIEDENIKSELIKINNKELLIFSTLISSKISKNKHKIIVAYPMTNGKFSSSHQYNAFCFFPTSEATQLKYLIHAPFLLTDNRQTVKKDNEWNNSLTERLGYLSAKSIDILRDNGLLNIDFFDLLPLDPNDFKTNYWEDTLFSPIYYKIKDHLIDENLLPNKSMTFSNPQESVLVRGRELTNLLSGDVLNSFKNSEDSYEIIFPHLTELKTTLWDYLTDELEVEVIRPEDLIKNLSIEFLEEREDEWLIKLYHFFGERKNLWNSIKDKPIVRLSDNSMSKPFKKGTPLVFLEEVDSNYPAIKSVFIKDNKSLELFKNLGIENPNKKDIIFRTIINRYISETDSLEVDEDLIRKDLLNTLIYYKSSNTEERKELINRFRDIQFLAAIDSEDKITYLNRVTNIYINSDPLSIFFENLTDSYYFFDFNYYKNLLDEYSKEDLIEFLLDLGASDIPIIEENNYDTTHPDFDSTNKKMGRKRAYRDYSIHGLQELFDHISFKKSVVAFDFIKLIHDRSNLENYAKSIFKYSYYGSSFEFEYDSQIIKDIRNHQWLYDKEGELKSPIELKFSELDETYNVDIPDSLKKIFGFKSEYDERFSLLSEDEKDLYELGKKLKEEGITESDIPEILALYKVKKTKNKVGEFRENNGKKVDSDTLIKKKKKNKERERKPETDTLIPDPVLTEDKIQKIKDELEEKELELLKLDELENIVTSSERYSFTWFKALLELEYINKKEDEIKRNPIRILFNRVQLDKDSSQMLVLYGKDIIPITIEDNGDLILRLTYKSKESKNIPVTAVSRQQKKLIAKLPDNLDGEALNIENIEVAVIELKNANFIFENLRSSFLNFKNEPFNIPEDYNFRDNLPESIDFIYGPPGTGKTTYLAHKIYNAIKTAFRYRILILCPTNKAADVLSKKIMGIILENKKNKLLDSLVRFGITNDADIEETIYNSSKYLSEEHLSRLVLITTSARISYDTFSVDEYKYSLKNYEWDTIIFDEASMITLPSIVFTIYNTFLLNNDIKFIVSGDPFQISPIIQTDEEGWKDGNIYSLVNLDKKNSFINPSTIPHSFNIINLPKQYRSVPVIGTLFSKLTYGGIIDHHRTKEDIKVITLNGLKLQPLTIINFEVNNYNSFYKPHRLNGSPYQIYSSIFVAEFVNSILKRIHLKNDDIYSVGVICPYKAQQDIIDKIISTFDLPKNINLTTGTIHSFQGDECDMMIAVFNPPRSISNSERIHLNKQRIINVALSRARDYLIMLMPVDPRQKILTENLIYLNKIREIINSDSEIKNSFIEYEALDIEKIILGNKKRIEDYCFSTSHQSVNVYSKLDKKYEIRYDENAIDIQVNHT